MSKACLCAVSKIYQALSKTDSLIEEYREALSADKHSRSLSKIIDNIIFKAITNFDPTIFKK